MEISPEFRPNLGTVSPHLLHKMPNRAHPTNTSTRMNKQTFEKVCQAIMATVDRKTKNGCWKSRNQPNGRGHVQIKVDGIKYLGHRMMAMWWKKRFLPYNNNIEASHLCGRRWCINPRHLWMEKAAVNLERYCCHRHQKTTGYLCPHYPRCIGLEGLYPKRPPMLLCHPRYQRILIK